MTLKHCHLVKRLMVLLVLQFNGENQISKESLAKNLRQLMADLKPELLKKTAVRL